MLSPELDDISDELSIRYAYLYLLGRPVEDINIVDAQLAANRTIKQVRNDVMRADEFTKEIALMYWNVQFKRLNINHTGIKPTDSIYMIQSCDPFRYVKLLNAASRFNVKWCLDNGVQYCSKPTLYIGKLPHYAMFNRIFMLNELIEIGYAGWVIWLDADGIVIDRSLDIKSFLNTARNDGFAFVMQHAGVIEGIDYWHNVNTGCFFVDLSNPCARFVISKWLEFYDAVFPLNVHDNVSWNDIINDQHSFVSIIRSLDGFSEKVLHYPTELKFTFHATRSNNLDISDEGELDDRVQQIYNVGRLFYSE